MPTEEQYKKLIHELRDELHRLSDEVDLRDEKLKEKNERLKQSVTKAYHKEKMDNLRKEYEEKLSEVIANPPRIHNERGAGRKRIATKEVAARVLELRGQGLSQAKITVMVAEEFNIKIGRTTVGEIIRGNYKLPDE